MKTDHFFDSCLKIVATLVSHVDKNWCSEGACRSLVLIVGGVRRVEDELVAHGGMFGWNLTFWQSHCALRVFATIHSILDLSISSDSSSLS